MAIKTMYIPWALWLSRSLKHYWEQNLRLLLCQRKKAGALPCAGTVRRSVLALSPDTADWPCRPRLYYPDNCGYTRQTYRRRSWFSEKCRFPNISHILPNISQHYLFLMLDREQSDHRLVVGISKQRCHLWNCSLKNLTIRHLSAIRPALSDILKRNAA